eukprot:COSAG02_NODE_36440_length_454_cov_1.267606_1_plen_42_part_01
MVSFAMAWCVGDHDGSACDIDDEIVDAFVKSISTMPCAHWYE